MKHLLLTTIAAVVLVGCGPSVDIHQAAMDGNIAAVKQHLDAGTDLEARDLLGMTPLIIAAHLGHKEIAELLITNGADVNAKDNIGATPLHKAALKGRKEAVELLIANGADVNAKDEIGGALHYAAASGHTEVVGRLIANGAEVNAKDIDGTTPLDLAIGLLKTETADLLQTQRQEG